MFYFTPNGNKKRNPQQPLNVEVNNVIPANVTHTVEKVKPLVERNLLKNKEVIIDTSSSSNSDIDIENEGNNAGSNSTTSEELIDNANATLDNSHGRYSNRSLYNPLRISGVEQYKRFKKLF